MADEFEIEDIKYVPEPYSPSVRLVPHITVSEYKPLPVKPIQVEDFKPGEMRHAVYQGSLKHFLGETAIVRKHDFSGNLIKAQFDNVRLENRASILANGWHVFLLSDFEIEDE